MDASQQSFTATMATPKHFLVAGGTGRQGGAVVTALLTDPSTPIPAATIHVITRNTSGATATHLKQQGVQLIHGDLNAPAAIFQRLTTKSIKPGDVAVFLAQAHGPTELSDAKGFIDAAASAGVDYFVYSSVDRGGKAQSGRDASYCKTFSDKFEIEKHLISTVSRCRKEPGPSGRSMDYTILRPTWFADNADWGFPGKLCMTAWRDSMKAKRLQVVVTRDIGRWAAEALLRPDAAGVRNDALSIASDELTFEEVDQIYREETGAPVPVTYGLIAGLMVWAINDLRTMFSWINERDYGADRAELQKVLQPTTFRMWVRSRSG